MLKVWLASTALLALIAPSAAGARSHDLRAVAEARAQALSFDGVLAVARGARPIYEQAFGIANRETRSPVTLATQFQIGSISKWFTVIVALKLAEGGKLDLHAPIGRYLDNYPVDIGRRVHVLDILSNTSGIKDRLPTTLINEPDLAASSLTAAAAVHRYAEGPLTFKPGTGFDYSHTNWVLAQAIVERAGGRPLAELLRQLVLGPLHLDATGISHGDFDRVSTHAVAYASHGPNAPRELHVIPRFLIPTGTIHSNCGDLIRAAHAIYNGGFLTPSSLRTLNTVRWAPEEYAIGGRIRLRRLGGSKKTIAFEIGSFGGFKALVEHVVEDDLTVVALNNSNMDEDELSTLGDLLLESVYARR